MSIKPEQLPILHRDYFVENIWQKEYIEKLVENPSYPEDYPNVLNDIKNCLNKLDILNKKILVVGSITPWIECYILSLGISEVFFTDINNIEIQDERIKYINLNDIKNYKFDVIISFSSVEHFGLGRYGDPINENGDIEFMNSVVDILNENGYFILGVPVAQKYNLCFPWHRIYDEDRIKNLTKKYKVILSSKNNKLNDYIDFSFDTFYEFDWQNQPCILLQKLDNIN